MNGLSFRTLRSSASFMILAVVIVLQPSLALSSSIERADVLAWLRVRQAMQSNEKAKPYYTESELDAAFTPGKSHFSKNELEEFERDIAETVKSLDADAAFRKESKKPFKGIKIRESYTDLIAAEDGSLPPGSKSPKKAADVKGAAVAFTRDLVNDSDTWAGKGAIAFPFIYTAADDGTREPFSLLKWGFVPSASLHRVASEDPMTADVNSLIYRAGFFGSFGGFSSPDRGVSEIVFRGSLAYGTDTDHLSETWAGEFDIEPRRDFLGRWALGYPKWIPKPGRQEEVLKFNKNGTVKDADWALANYRLRTWLHGEFGNVQKLGGMAGVDEGDFFRMGPAVDLFVNFPMVAPLTLNAKYRYLGSLDGNTEDSSLFEASAEWTFWQDLEAGRRISGKVSYLNGGLDLTGEEAETVLVGLGVTF